MKKAAILFLQLIIFVVLGSFSSFGQTRTISSVSITCQGAPEAGQVLSEIEVDTTGSGQGQISLQVHSTAVIISDCTLALQKGSTRTLSVGDVVKATLILESTDPEELKFLGNYSSSNVRISGGTFASASASEGRLRVTFTFSPVRGMLTPPEDPVWKGVSGSSKDGPGSSGTSGTVSSKNIGKASWSAPAGKQGAYEVWLYCAGSVVHKFTQLTERSVDCYPYMTKRGTYYFKVRNIPVDAAEKKYAQPSEWAVSDEYYLDAEHVSSGAGQAVSSSAVGWIRSGNDWYYKFPDGTLRRNGWEKVGGKWYLFDKEGKMLTGKQTTAGGTFYLASSGEMLTGWQKIGNEWYFFKNTPGSADEGVMLARTWINEPEGKTYYLGDKGVMLTGWQQIGENWYYFDPSGNLARNTWISTFYVNADGVWVRNP